MATYVTGSNSPLLTFQYVVGKTDQASAVAIGQRMVFAKGSGIAAGSEKLPVTLPAPVAGFTADGVRFDATPPAVTGRIGVPASGPYGVGQSLDFVVRFFEPVTVTGQPQIALAGLRQPRNATYLSGSGTAEITFRYVVQPGDSTRPGAALALGKTITLPGGATLVDAAGNRAIVSLPTTSLKGIRIDATAASGAFATLGRRVRPASRPATVAAFASLE